MVIAAPQVQRGDVLGSLDVVDALFDGRDRVLVLLGVGVETHVVVADANLVFLSLEQDGGPVLGRGRLDESSIERQLDLCLEFGQLGWREAVWLSGEGPMAFLELDLELDISLGREAVRVGQEP